MPLVYQVLYCIVLYVLYCTGVPGSLLAARGLPRGQREERGDRRRGAQGQGDLVLVLVLLAL